MQVTDAPKQVLGRLLDPADLARDCKVELRVAMLFALLLFLLGFSVGQESLSSCDTNGAFPDPDQCDKYWECRGGNLTSHLCPDGLVYDLTTSVASFQVVTELVIGL